MCVCVCCKLHICNRYIQLTCKINFFLLLKLQKKSNNFPVSVIYKIFLSDIRMLLPYSHNKGSLLPLCRHWNVIIWWDGMISSCFCVIWNPISKFSILEYASMNQLLQALQWCMLLSSSNRYYMDMIYYLNKS